MASVTMRPTGELSAEMLALIESQAEGTATFQLPGAVVVALARAARRGLETTSQLPVERATEGGLHSAQQLVAFFTPAQRFALRAALERK